MALDPATAAIELAGAVVNGGVQIASEVITTEQTRRLDAANAKAQEDVTNFKNDVLAGNLESVDLRLDGLQHGVGLDLTVAEAEQLKRIVPGLDGLSLVGLYCRARCADLAAERAQILIDTASTVKP